MITKITRNGINGAMFVTHGMGWAQFVAWFGDRSWATAFFAGPISHCIIFLVKKLSFVSGYWECAEEIREQHPLLQRSAGSVEHWRVII